MMFPDLPYYKVNREERHFGFLFLSALVTNTQVQKRLIDYINTKISGRLDYQQIDVYAEVTLFRDYWRALGDPARYTPEIHSQRLQIFVRMLETMGLDPSLIDVEPVFWTGKPGNSKLFYPGKWGKEKIKAAEKKYDLVEKELWRLRWACNAKPDVMIEDPRNIVFIEIKVESDFGSSENGYNQLQTQEDILLLGKAVIPSFASKNTELTTLTQGGPNLVWSDIINILSESPDAEIFALAKRHLKSMPTPSSFSSQPEPNAPLTH